jgi:hypothetical protein
MSQTVSEKKTLKVHVELIVGIFLVGTLAFMVASSWNVLLFEILTWLKEDNNFLGTADNGMLAYTAIYAVLITLFSVGVLALLINFEYINHSSRLY